MAIKQTKQQLHSEEVKNSIVNKAEELFREYGVDSVSMKELASALGFTTGTIYHHFASKEELLDSIAIRHSRSHSLDFDKYKNATDPIAAIQDFFKEIIIEQVKADGFVFTEHRVMRLVDPKRSTPISGLIKDLIEKAKCSGQLREDTPSEDTAGLLIALNRESCYEYVRSGGDERFLYLGIDRIKLVLEAFSKQ